MLPGCNFVIYNLIRQKNTPVIQSLIDGTTINLSTRGSRCRWFPRWSSPRFCTQVLICRVDEVLMAFISSTNISIARRISEFCPTPAPHCLPIHHQHARTNLLSYTTEALSESPLPTLDFRVSIQPADNYTVCTENDTVVPLINIFFVVNTWSIISFKIRTASQIFEQYEIWRAKLECIQPDLAQSREHLKHTSGNAQDISLQRLTLGSSSPSQVELQYMGDSLHTYP